MKYRFFFILLCLLSSAGAQDVKATDHSDMVIADVHRHVQHWITPSSLLAEMDELKIGWLVQWVPLMDHGKPNRTSSF